MVYRLLQREAALLVSFSLFFIFRSNTDSLILPCLYIGCGPRCTALCRLLLNLVRALRPTNLIADRVHDGTSCCYCNPATRGRLSCVPLLCGASTDLITACAANLGLSSLPTGTTCSKLAYLGPPIFTPCHPGLKGLVPRNPHIKVLIRYSIPSPYLNGLI